MVTRSDKTTVTKQDIENTPWMLLLSKWFLAGHRDLAWRNIDHPNAYHVWVSEIMLQQTRVEAVRRYFDRFMARLPRLSDLAEVSEDELMKLWEGLGYYSRARNLKKCAQVLMKEYDGQLPKTKEELVKLPGIGPYTAGAIASIAYQKPVAAVDGNVLRVMTRLFADDSDITLERTRAHWQDYITDQLRVATVSPSVVNQAIMELGAMVCVPNGAPNCSACPLEAVCMARKTGNVLDYPVKTAAKKRKIEERIVYLILSDNRVLVHKRPQKGLLAGLYEFPNCKVDETPDRPVIDLIPSDQLQEQNGVTATHIFSHIEWHMKGVEVACKRKDLEDEQWLWISLEDLKHRIAIPGAFRAYVDRVKILLSEEAYG